MAYFEVPEITLTDADRLILEGYKAMVEAIATGAAGSFQLSNVAKKGMNGDFAPGFMMKHFVKDMGLADEEAVRNGIKLPVLENVLDICRRLEGAGCAEEGTQSILKFYE